MAADGEHPLVEESLLDAEEECMPHFTGFLSFRLAKDWKRYAGTVAFTGCLTKQLLGRRPSLRTLVGPGLFLVAGLFVEIGVRWVASRLLQWRAAAVQQRALLADVETEFALAVPHELELEERLAGRVWVTKASFGVSNIWFRRMRHRGWTWSTDLRHWQSVKEHSSTGGMSQSLLPVPSNRWLLRRLHLRDVRDRMRAPRTAHAPPPLSLPADLGDAPADFLCPISHAVMTDPVVSPAGVSYERAALGQWLRLRKTDPSTQGPLEMHDVYTNLSLRSMITTWVQCQCHHGPGIDRQADNAAGGGTSEARHTAERSEHGGRVAPKKKKKLPRATQLPARRDQRAILDVD